MGNLTIIPRSNNSRKALRLYHESVQPPPGGTFNVAATIVSSAAEGPIALPVGGGITLLTVPITWDPSFITPVGLVNIDIPVSFKLTYDIVADNVSDFPIGVVNTTPGSIVDPVGALVCKGKPNAVIGYPYSATSFIFGRCRVVTTNTGAINLTFTFQSPAFPASYINPLVTYLIGDGIAHPTAP